MFYFRDGPFSFSLCDITDVTMSTSFSTCNIAQESRRTGIMIVILYVSVTRLSHEAAKTLISNTIHGCRYL